MRVITATQMKEIDRRAIEEIGISSLCLMENAGRLVADEVQKILFRQKSRQVVLICGMGNNGGDGFVAARYLQQSGVKVTVLIAGQPGKLKSDARCNYRILQQLSIPCYEAFRLSSVSLRRLLQKSGVIVDAIFGVGLNRAIAGPMQELIQAVNAARRPVIAVDVPSGLDATTGQVLGICIQARRTVTLAVGKRGLCCGEGPKHAGRVVVVDIGIPLTLVRSCR